MFASWTAASLSRALASADPDLSGEKAHNPDSIPYDPTRLGKLEDMLRRYEDHFGRHLRILTDRLVMMRLHPDDADWTFSLNYFAATESAVLLKLAHALTSISKED
jgi:gamma-tubulin complex component 2